MFNINLKINECKWLSAKNGKSCPQDHSTRIQIIKDFITWLFMSYINPILSCYFYVTETSQHKKSIFYFRHDVWQRMTQLQFATLSAKLYKPVLKNELKMLDSRQETLGPSKIRLLPKNEGVRILCNLKRKGSALFPKSKMAKHNLSVNLMLENVLHVMKFERKTIGPATGMHSFKENFIQFKQK